MLLRMARYGSSMPDIRTQVVNRLIGLFRRIGMDRRERSRVARIESLQADRTLLPPRTFAYKECDPGVKRNVVFKRSPNRDSWPPRIVHGAPSRRTRFRRSNLDFRPCLR